MCLSVCIVLVCLANESSKEINRTSVNGVTYLGGSNINRTKSASIEINTPVKGKNTTFFNMTELKRNNELTYSNNFLLVWSPMIVGTVVTPISLSIFYVLLRCCKLKKQTSQNLHEETEEQTKFLHENQAINTMSPAVD